MEIFLVDAHALAWFIAQSPRLSQSAAEVLRKGERAEVEILVPTIVLAELLYIAERKKVPVSLAEILKRIGSGGGFRVVPFDFLVFETMRRLPKSLEIHDRIIVATAQAYRAKVISQDAQIKRVITTVW